MGNKQRYVSVPTENLRGRVGVNFATLPVITWDIQIVWNRGARGMFISPTDRYLVPMKWIPFCVMSCIFTGDSPVVTFSHFAPVAPPVYA